MLGCAFCRDVKQTAGQGEVAKLFAKHCKVSSLDITPRCSVPDPDACARWQLAEHEKYCREKAFSIAIGTPSRVHQLLNSDPPSLGLDSVSHLILDVSFLDGKKRFVSYPLLACHMSLAGLTGGGGGGRPRSILENEGKQVVFKDILGDGRIRDKLAAQRLKLVFF